MIQFIRDSFIARIVALILIPQLILPMIPGANANGGPIDGNFQSVGEGEELVDISSGDFSYSVPLLDVGGYPITLNYNADIGMDQQASMVGLGWSINTGAINRVVRGIPDDFDGDSITTIMNIRPQYSTTNIGDVNSEIVGLDVGGQNGAVGVGLSFGYTFNNYTGNENIVGANLSLGLTENPDGSGQNAFLNTGLSSSSRSGLTSNFGVALALGEDGKFNTSLGLNRNSLYGSSLNFSFGYPFNVKLKGKKGKVGLSGSGVYPLGMQSYTPTSSFEFENKSWSFDLGAGVTTVAGLDIHATFTNIKTTVCLKDNVRSQKAYGYMNQEKGYDKYALQDFNLNLPQMHDNTPAVSTPVPTNDYFMVATNGTMFRAVRNDAGYVKDPTSKSEGSANGISGDVGILPPVNYEVGVNYTYHWNNTTTGVWEAGNPFCDNSIFEFTSSTPNSDPVTKVKYEKFTFQKVNNGSTVSDNQYVGVREGTALRQEIYLDGSKIKSHGYMVDDEGSPNYDVTNNYHYQHERRDRNTVYEYVDNYRLNLLGDNSFKDYTLNNFSFSNGAYTSVVSKSRNSADYPSAHIGQFTIVGAGGYREVYGIPVMNESDQVTFNISKYHNMGGTTPSQSVTDGLVTYSPGVDNSLNNKRGDNHLYIKNHVPKHATSYLLTELLSDNYSDRTGNGPTPDDYGDYTKFNYAYEGAKKWRFPYEVNKAVFDEGFKADELDDRGSYSYGVRDEWFVHSIETKDYIAEFVYENRNDARPVAGENGNIGSGYSKRLKEIKLYTRKGKEYGKGPLRTVHFVYDYSLCDNTPDNPSGGKLTLKELYFTNYDSPHGQLYRYKFSYGTGNANPDYNPAHTDRWGDYQKHDFASSLDNMEYPYTLQDKAKADANAQKWKLTAIDLPSGARIEVDYESDDYEYIQNYEATRMYMVYGFYSRHEAYGQTYSDPVAGDFGSDLFDPDASDENSYFIAVKLDNAITAGTAADAENIFENEFLPRKDLSGKRHLYFNTLLNLAPHNDGIVDPDVYEYIQGYAEIIDGAWYLLESIPGVWDKVVYKVKPERLNETKPGSPKTNPVSRKAWQVIKEALPLVLYPENNLFAIYAKDGSISCGSGPALEDGGTEPELGDDSKNHKKNLKSIVSVYHMMRNTGFASRAELNKCWVRMRCGEAPKYGGGHRVKEIRMYDNWDQFVAGEAGSVYGTRYEYTTTNKFGETISSGVASYEPINRGGDEIALRYPKYYIHTQKGTPSEKFYTEFPLNEQIFESSQIRYSQVKTSSIDYPGLSINTPGYTVYKYYTAKDFPLQFDYTLANSVVKPPGIVGLLGVSIRRYGISYGAAIVANDMHGKLKSKTVYNAGGNEISRMEYHYRTDGTGKLSSLIPTINPDGSYGERLMGLTVDMLTHINKSEANSSKVKIKVNGEITLPFVVVPSFWPGGNTNEVSIHSTLTTKVIYQSGILEEIIVEDNGRLKATKNLLYDAKSGSAIATEITPEEGDGIQRMYDYQYPAYWAYPGMGMASDNVGITRMNVVSGSTMLNAEKQYFSPGDELQVFVTSSPSIPIPVSALENHWVVENETSGDYFLVDADGNVFSPAPSTNYMFRVHNPGKSNEASIVMAAVSTLKKHTGNSPYTPGYPHDKVLNVSGTDFFDYAKLRTDPCAALNDDINPYVHNLKGIWKSEHSYSFDGKRNYSAANSRKDGLLTDYQPFWQNVSGTWLPIYDPGRTDFNASDPLQDWIKNGNPTLFDSYGYNLESKSTLGIYQASGTGYNQQIETYGISNAMYAEAGYDGFEDYFSDGIYNLGTTTFTPYGCHQRHFGVTNAAGVISDDEAHTGRYSWLVSKTEFIEIPVWDGISPAQTTHGSPFTVGASDVIQPIRFLNDQPDNRYVLTVWIKEINPSFPTNYSNTISVYANGGYLPLDERRSNIIDGWQRLELTFNIDGGLANGTLVKIYFGGAEGGVYFDDLRIQPFDSEIESTVFDPINRRPVASLDNRNFATIYQYDEAGRMVRMIQETENGKHTIKETRSGIAFN